MKIGKRLIGTLVVAVLLISGCKKNMVKTSDSEVIPSLKQYDFISTTPELEGQMHNLYPRRPEKAPLLLAAYISSPDGFQICFSGNKTPWRVNNYAGEALHFRTGVYPFRLYKIPEGETEAVVDNCKKSTAVPTYSGAMTVFNLDKTVELVTFGLSDETKLFNSDLLDKVRDGYLTNYTISFDDKPRLVYWLGNRQDAYAGGAPTAELDFSKNGIAELEVDGELVHGYRATVDVYEKRRVSGRNMKARAEHRFRMQLTDGREFSGYVRRLRDDAFTAFTKIPCQIPQELFDAASKGTIAKLGITSGGDDKKEIAEIVFGVKK